MKVGRLLVSEKTHPCLMHRHLDSAKRVRVSNKSTIFVVCSSTRITSGNLDFFFNKESPEPKPLRVEVGKHPFLKKISDAMYADILILSNRYKSLTRVPVSVICSSTEITSVNLDSFK